jgi:uncharacterized protein (TIGR02246 family)
MPERNYDANGPVGQTRLVEIGNSATTARSDWMNSMDSVLEKRLRRLEDREEIAEILVEYGRTLDAGDAEAYSRLFARDGEWIGGKFRANSPAQIKEMIERLVASRGGNDGSNHIMSNFVIRVDGDTAKAWSRWMLVVPGTDGKPTIRIAGRYDDLLIREDGHWKFLRRSLTHDLRAASPIADSLDREQ